MDAKGCVSFWLIWRFVITTLGKFSTVKSEFGLLFPFIHIYSTATKGELWHNLFLIYGIYPKVVYYMYVSMGSDFFSWLMQCMPIDVINETLHTTTSIISMTWYRGPPQEKNGRDSFFLQVSRPCDIGPSWIYIENWMKQLFGFFCYLIRLVFHLPLE